jgi:hypothetical protein
MKFNWTKKLLGGLCLSSVAFVFQACYGTPQDFGEDLFVQGKVTDKTTGLPIKGIKVSVVDRMQYLYTNEEGHFSFYTMRADSTVVRFEDVDSIENCSYASKEIVLPGSLRVVDLTIDLDELK